MPREFSDTIRLGNIDLQMYINSCGVKFIIGRNIYVLQYLYCNRTKKEEYEPRNWCLVEEVVETNFGETIFYGNPEDIEKFFVMQFFRYIEKLPHLHEIIYSELNKLSDKEMVQFFNKVGKKLSHGAEFNFQRGFYIPIECITQIQILSNFDQIPRNEEFRAVNYGASHFFNKPQFKPITINMSDIINSIQQNDLKTLLKYKNICPQLFLSVRFIRYMLHACEPNTLVYKTLMTWFNEIYKIQNDGMYDAPCKLDHTF